MAKSPEKNGSNNISKHSMSSHIHNGIVVNFNEIFNMKKELEESTNQIHLQQTKSNMLKEEIIQLRDQNQKLGQRFVHYGLILLGSFRSIQRNQKEFSENSQKLQTSEKLCGKLSLQNSILEEELSKQKNQFSDLSRIHLQTLLEATDFSGNFDQFYSDLCRECVLPANYSAFLISKGFSFKCSSKQETKEHETEKTNVADQMEKIEQTMEKTKQTEKADEMERKDIMIHNNEKISTWFYSTIFLSLTSATLFWLKCK